MLLLRNIDCWDVRRIKKNLKLFQKNVNEIVNFSSKYS
jgi:hypothetical protein